MLGDSVGVIVATYGDYDQWLPLAERAVRSAAAQTRRPDFVAHIHKDTLHEARNYGAEYAETDWLIFLDADDELDTRYIEFMMNRAAQYQDGENLLIQPSTLGVVNGITDPYPVLIPSKPSLLDGNWLVIGTLMRRSSFLKAGGFSDYPFWEDWELMIRLWIDGALITAAPDAIYRVFVNPRGRNTITPASANAMFQKVTGMYRPLAQEKGLI